MVSGPTSPGGQRPRGRGGREILGTSGKPEHLRRSHRSAAEDGDGEPVAPPGHRLPATFSSFIGREQESAEVAKLLSASRLVTLVGPGGVGKTRLALEVGHDVAADYPDGACFVALDELADARLLTGVVASALSVHQRRGDDLDDTMMAHLRPRRLLLVLDNCEHLIEPVAELADRLLRSSPGLSVLATSRERLGVMGESVRVVAPLSLPDGCADLPPEALLDSEAVRLFVDRAASIRSDFALDAATAAAVADICCRVDGLPLAIELAAARLDSLAPGEIAARIDDRFALLTVGNRTAPPRHQTLLKAFQWSHDLLTAGEQVVLRRLSVFCGGFTLDAAEEVCAGDGVDREEMLSLLSRLVAKSLVCADTHGGTARYRMLDTVRAFAHGRLAAEGQEPRLRMRHARWCLAFAREARWRLVGSIENDWRDRVRAELGNLRCALEWTLADATRPGPAGVGREELAEVGLALAEACVPLFIAQNLFCESRQWIARALAASDDEASPALRMRARGWASYLAMMACDFSEAVPAAEEAAALAAKRDPAARAHSLTRLGFLYIFTREPSAALPLLEEAVTLARAAKNKRLLGNALIACGRAHLFRGDATAARRCAVECLELFAATGNPRSVEALVGLGWALLALGDHRGARAVLEEAVASPAEANTDYARALALSLLGEVRAAGGDRAVARRLMGASIQSARAMGTPFPLARALTTLGEVELADGDVESARSLLHEALAAARRAGLGYLVVRALLALGEATAAGGDRERAGELFEEALATATDKGDQQGVARSKHELGRLASVQGDHAKALALHHEALRLHHRLNDVAGVADCLEAVAGLVAHGGRFDHAVRLLGAADAMREAGGFGARRSAATHDEELARLRHELGDDDFDAAWSQGLGMSRPEAVSYASRSRGSHGRSSHGWDSLTRTEREVVALVQQGLTNPEIAERLFVSAHTVRNHLSHVFSKLGVSSRVELARDAWQAGTAEPS